MHEASNRERKKNPREGAGFFSIVTFFFAADIFKQSKHRDLENEDIYKIQGFCHSADLGDKLQKQWTEEQKKKRHSSLGKTLFSVFGNEYMYYGMLNLFFRTSIIVVRPWATGKLVSFFETNIEVSYWNAVGYAVLVFLCGFILSIYNQYYQYSVDHLCIRIRVALCSLIYRKSLKLTTSSLAEVTSGKIVTLITKDAQNFQAALHNVHDLWVGGLQLFVVAYLLSRKIGAAALVGIGFLAIVAPFQAWMGVKTKQMRLKTAAKTDERLRRIQEVLTSIKLIKLYTWEKYYTKVVNMVRCEEMKKLRAIFYLKNLILGVSAFSTRVSFFLCLLSYSLMGFTITSETAFYVISCYKSLDSLFGYSIPLSVSQIAEAKSALKRIKSYLLAEERSQPKDRDCVKMGKVCVNAAGARIQDKIILKDVNVEISSPSLVGITGEIGGGKSSFLKVVLQDIDICDGTVATNGKISYASQEPWLFPGTIRQNILFGNDYDEKRYDKVLHVCALKKDLKSFSEKDATVVNDKGVNLSKGQQARINLARAVYKISDVYLLDDVLSSLDANVGRHVFDNCIKHFLRDKLCFFVCHGEKYLQRTDTILVFDEGTIKSQGTYTELKKQGVQFENAIIKMDTVNDVVARKADLEGETDEDLLLQPLHSFNENVYGEHKQLGKVPFKVYNQYVRFAGGWFIVLLVVAICAGTQFMGTFFDQYVRSWIDLQTQYREVLSGSNLTINQSHVDNVKAMNDRGILIYLALIVSYVVLIIFELFSFYTITVAASRNMHIHVFSRIMGAVTAFFDANLSGNVLNRLAKDTSCVDEVLSFIFFEVMELIAILSAIFIIKPVLIAPAAGFFLVIWYVRSRFLNASRSLQRLDGITKAPVVGYINASLEGLTTIRANENQSLLEKQFDKHQNLNSSTSVMALTIYRAFSLWIDILTHLFNIFVFSSFLIYSSIASKSGDVGFVITEVFGLASVVTICIADWAELEFLMASLERVLEYADADQEDLTGDDPKNWPSNGTIEYKDVQLQYPFSKDLVLQGVNFSVEAGQKVGIVGRTGAGKSSIVSALFRLYKFEGSILVDGVDVKDVKLPAVRSRISVIPQDPVMFKGTVRTNLDPYEEYTDENIWTALEDVGLKDTMESLGLSSEINEGGSNWSIGQRQLFCLARAVLRNNKIVVLDEPTANIDHNTDAFIQDAIGRLFKHCTILTIAHRINTVINSEKIMVIDNGAVVEFDSPQNLLNRKDGAFYTVAREAGLVD